MSKQIIVGITLDDVLRDFSSKFIECYTKSFPEGKISEKVDIYNIMSSFEFKDAAQVNEFLNVDHCLDIFGISEEVYKGCVNDLNNLIQYYSENEIEVIIISKEFSKTKPASLYFLSRTGCEANKTIFIQKDIEYFNYCDILVTTNYKLFENDDNIEKIYLIDKPYNSHIDSKMRIKNIKDLFNVDLNSLKKR